MTMKRYSPIIDAIADSAVSPHRLELELTESLFIDDPGLVARTLADIKEISVKLAIDDFGTGYSSLNYLKRYPIDYLKIDQSFVRDIHADADDAAIVQAVIALAKSLRLKVVAEGVEHLNQLDYLRSLDCDQIQGYLFSKPVSVEQFKCLLRSPVLHPLE